MVTVLLYHFERSHFHCILSDEILVWGSFCRKLDELLECRGLCVSEYIPSLCIILNKGASLPPLELMRKLETVNSFHTHSLGAIMTAFLIKCPFYEAASSYLFKRNKTTAVFMKRAVSFVLGGPSYFEKVYSRPKPEAWVSAC